MLALAEDHLNDIISNAAAVATAVLATAVADGWWIDPAGAIVISLYIVCRWVGIAQVQVRRRRRGEKGEEEGGGRHAVGARRVRVV
jgi:divalent metal cation (Fe/Co/Zn/Cd) transporter